MFEYIRTSFFRKMYVIANELRCVVDININNLKD